MLLCFNELFRSCIWAFGETRQLEVKRLWLSSDFQVGFLLSKVCTSNGKMDGASELTQPKKPYGCFLPARHREAPQSILSLGNILFSPSWFKLWYNTIILQPSVSELGLIYGPATVKINGIVVAPRRGCHNRDSVSKVWSWFIYPRRLCSKLWAGMTNEASMKLSCSLGDHIQEAWLNGWRATQA